MKSTPGPLPSSCLTCRRRKVHCDKARPACSRCLASGIPCLGYDHIPAVESSSYHVFSLKSRSSAKPSHRRSKTQPTAGTQGIVDVGSCVPEPVNDLVHRHGEDAQPVNCREILPVPRISAQPPAQSHLEVVKPVHSTSLSDGYQSSTNNEIVQPTFLSPAQKSLHPAMLFHLPRRITPDPAHSGEILEFIMSQYGPLLEVVLFNPTQVFLGMVRKNMTMRIHSSTHSRYSMYIGARIFQALTNDGKRADLRYLSSCLARLGQQLFIKSTNESTFDGLTNFLSAGLELAFLYFVISNSQAGYTLLKTLIPTFLQVALLDCDLWSWQPDCAGISLIHALHPLHPSVFRFVIMDALTSLTFGVPLLIEYDTSLPRLSAVRSVGRISPSVAAPELAPEFTIMIVRISVWRAKNPGLSAPEDIWKPLETELWACQQSADVPVEAGTLHSVAGTLQSVTRVVITEGWRHALLIYLYMGMCGVASDDPRVQSSTKQIMKLLQVVQDDWNTMNHFFLPCLMASICTPNEKHRAELSDAFLRVEGTKPWLFKVMDYKPVIDHLWHGAAANGRPVYWEDYIDSRRAMLHID